MKCELRAHSENREALRGGRLRKRCVWHGAGKKTDCHNRVLPISFLVTIARLRPILKWRNKPFLRP